MSLKHVTLRGCVLQSMREVYLFTWKWYINRHVLDVSLP